MRIAFIAHYPASALLSEEDIKPKYRGTEHSAPWVRLLAEALAALPDTDVIVMIDSRAVTSTSETTSNGVTYHFIPKREPIRCDPYLFFRPAAWRMKQSLKKYRPDVVVGFGAESGNGYVACLLPWPRVVFLQGIMEKCFSYFSTPRITRWFWTMLERALPMRADGLMAETTFARDWALGVNPSARIQVIPHVMDPYFLNGPAAAANKPDIISVGSLIRLKGNDTIIRALADCGIADSRLILIGDGPARPELEELARTLGVADRVVFRGRLNRAGVCSALAEARIFVLASRMDTSPNSITEAHAAGLPVIATNTGGISDMVSDGSDGFLFPVDDAVSLTNRLRELLPDPSRCRKMGQAGREKVQVIHDPSRVAREVREFLCATIDHAGKTRL